jgi:hypothetical protein
MTAGDTDWLLKGEGRRPHLAWSFGAEAPLAALRYARETGETLAADAVGGLYRLDRSGKLLGLTHGPAPVRALAWSDTGAGGLALVGEAKLHWFDRQLNFQGSTEQSDPVLGVAIEAHGHYAAVSLSSSANVLYDARRKIVRRFSSMQPLSTFEFLLDRPALLSITEYGLLCCHHFNGESLWQQQLFANVGDLAVTGDGQSILLACYMHGIQRHDGRGVQVGSYQVGGTVCRVSSNFVARRIAAATIERHFYYMDDDGQVVWQAILPDDICRVICDPLVDAVLCGFQSGRIVRIEWRQAE